MRTRERRMRVGRPEGACMGLEPHLLVQAAADKLRVHDLKSVMATLGISKAGRKQELVDRAVSAVSGELEHSGVSPDSALDTLRRVCIETNRGRCVAEALSFPLAPGPGFSASNATHRPYNIAHHHATIHQAPHSRWQRPSQHALPYQQQRPPQPPPPIPYRRPRENPSDDASLLASMRSYANDKTVVRVRQADPFYAPPNTACEVVVPPKSIKQSLNGPDRTVMLESTFAIPRAVMDAKRAGNELHFCCVLVNDQVSSRMHWPCHVEVKMNNMQVQVPSRSRQHPLGSKSRDPPGIVSPMASESNNRLILRGKDNRHFIGFLRLARRRSFSEVRRMIPASQPMQNFVERAKKHCSAFGGDEDLVIKSNTELSLSCPITGSRVNTPVRLRDCHGLAVFDLDSFLQMVQRTRKWLCPHCETSGDPASVIIDTFLLSIISQLDAEGRTDVTRIELDGDANWRPVLDGAAESLPMRSPHSLPEKHHDPKAENTSPPSKTTEGGNTMRDSARAPDVNIAEGNDEPDLIVLDCDEGEQQSTRENSVQSAQDVQEQAHRHTQQQHDPRVDQQQRRGFEHTYQQSHAIMRPNWSPMQHTGGHQEDRKRQKHASPGDDESRMHGDQPSPSLDGTSSAAMAFKWNMSCLPGREQPQSAFSTAPVRPETNSAGSAQRYEQQHGSNFGNITPQQQQPQTSEMLHGLQQRLLQGGDNSLYENCLQPQAQSPAAPNVYAWES